MAQRRQVPRPRHLFPEAAAFLIDVRRSALYFGFGSRAAFGRIPVWILGSLAGITAVMLTATLFFSRDPVQAAPVAAAPVEVPPVTPVFTPEPISTLPNPPVTTVPMLQPVETPIIASPPPIKNLARLTMDLERTNFDVPFDEVTVRTRSSFDQKVEIPNLTLTDLWRRAIQRSSFAAPFYSYVASAAQVSVPSPALMASEQVPLQRAPESNRDVGLLIEKSIVPLCTPGESVSYEITLINVSLKTIEQVVVRERISELQRVTEVLPTAGLSDNELVWTLTSLEPGATKKLKITLVPEVAGEIFTETLVLPTTRLAATVNVRAPAPVRQPNPPQPPPQQPAPVVARPPQGTPQLKLTYTALPSLKQGDTLSMIFSLTNIGTAPADDVQLYLRLSGEFEHRYGDYVHHRVGRLEPGQTRRALLQATARTPGQGRLVTSVTMQGNETEARELRIPISSVAGNTSPSNTATPRSSVTQVRPASTRESQSILAYSPELP